MLRYTLKSTLSTFRRNAPQLRTVGSSATQRFSQPVRRRTNWGKIFLITTGTLAATGGSLWWFFWPHHTYSSNVAKILRKALWAEMERGGFDYQKALEHYIEALQLAQEEGLDDICDEYTGIQLKIGEMYERLHMNNEALMIYSEIASAYLAALTTPGRVPDHLRPHYVQKDLRVIVKMVELNKNNAHASKMLLMTHFLIAQDEVSKRSKFASKLIQSEKVEVYDEITTGKHSSSPEINESEIKITPQGQIPKNREAWEPFRDELFNARDLYVAICVTTGDLIGAVRAKIATTEWMLNADCEPGDILLSQTNLGSIMYLQAEEYEVREYSGHKENKQEIINEAKLNKERCLDLSSQCYQSVLQFAKNLPSNLRRENTVEEAIALSTYGLGVIKLHLGQYEAAKNLLREARLRAKGAGFDDLVSEAERELTRLGKELEKRGSLGDEIETDRIKQLLQVSEKDQPDIEMDVQLAKHK